MEKNIIGWKLIKLYPGCGKFLGTIVKHFSDGQYRGQWPEFWEPIYETGIDLSNIFDSKFREMFPEYDRSKVNYAATRQTTIELMRKACEEVLKLAAEKAKLNQTYGYKFIIDKQSILDCINLVK